MPAPETILSPFRAIRYQTSETHDLSHLLAPPYDVVSEAMHAELLARHAHNFIRVELPEDGDGRYEAAASVLKDWPSPDERSHCAMSVCWAITFQRALEAARPS